MLVLLAGCAAAPLHPAEDPAAAWLGRCETLRENLLGEPSAGVTTSPWPAKSPATPLWVLAVDGTAVPIPPVRYRDIRFTFSPLSGGLPTVVLEGDAKPLAIAITSVIPPPAYEDLFAVAGEGPTPQGCALTRRLFGGPVTHERLMEVGYAGRPEDLTCRPENREREVPLAAALILKTVGGGLTRVYRGIGGREGWVTRSADDGTAVRWQATLIGKDRWVLVTLRVNDDGPFREAGLAFGKTDTVRAEGRPLWLSALAAVLEDSENARLREALADTVEAAGFPLPSVERIRRPAAEASR